MAVTLDYSPETLRARFHVLKKQRDDIRAKTTPLRAERDKIENEARQKCDKLIEQVRELERPMAAVKAEMAVLVRALNGKTGSPPGE